MLESKLCYNMTQTANHMRVLQITGTPSGFYSNHISSRHLFSNIFNIYTIFDYKYQAIIKLRDFNPPAETTT